MDKQLVAFKDLGIIGYQEAWDFQEARLQENVSIKSAARISGENLPAHELPTKNHLFFCEHPPVYTIGKSGLMEHVLITEDERQKKGVAFYKTNRGGDITFHGLQQLVGYPILDLEKFTTDIGLYLRNLEEAIIQTIAAWGIIGDRSKGETGVWIEPGVAGRERKIAAIGVRCSRWITMHGFALNVNTNLDYFNHIIPCGIQNKQVTSMKQELGEDVDFKQVKTIFLEKFADIFQVEYQHLTN